MAQPEKRYGLIEPKKKLSVADVFRNDSDDETPTQAQKKNTEKGLKKQTVIDMNRALLEDPTVYQYDEVYDTMKKMESATNKPKEERKTKYMDALIKTADRRKKENERRTERLVQKEREAEGETFKDKEEFITSSYRKKLEELKVAEEEEKKMEYIESVMDVSKQKDLGSFYRHLYKETLPETEKSNDLAPPAEVKEKKENEIKEEPKGSSSSSSDSDSSSDSSSSDSSSTDQEVPKTAKDNPANEKEEKNKVLEDGEIISAPEEDKSKLILNNEKVLKFGSHTRRDRSYRQRDSNNKAFELRKSSEREQKNGSQEDRQRNDKNRDRNRERDRAKDSDRKRRDDRRSGLSWRSNERVQNDRKNTRRQRSRSRSNRDNDNRRNTTVKKDDKKDKDVLDSKRKNKSDKLGEVKELTEKKNDQTEKNTEKAEKVIKKSDVSQSSSDHGKENVEVIVDIWKKRTVGPVFDAALERYHQRKALKNTIG